METNYTNSCPVPNGILFIVGGHENKGEKQDKKVQEAHRSKEVLDTFVKLVGEKESTIEVITTGSSEGGESFKDYHKAFTSLGVSHVGHIHHDSRNSALRDQELVHRIS